MASVKIHSAWPIGWLLLVLMTMGVAQSASAGSPERARPTQGFLDFLGVNTHTAWQDLSYSTPDGGRDVAKVERLLSYLGISRIRDSAGAAWMRDEYQQLGRSGIQLELMISTERGADPLTQQLLTLTALARFLCGIEGPNEADLSPAMFDGLYGADASRALQAQLLALVREWPVLERVPVLETSIGHAEAIPRYAAMAHADLANMHSYFFDFATPIADQLPSRLKQARTVAPERPIVTTETGWPTRGVSGGYVDESTQAVLILDDLLDQFRASVLQTYIYQLIDEPRSNDYYGLFTESGAPKLAGVAVHNLTTLLADRSARGAARTLDFAVPDLPQTARSLLLQKGTGQFWIVLWNELPVWDAGHDAPLTARVVTVTLRVASISHICWYDPMVGLVPKTMDSASGSFSLDLPPHPILVSLQQEQKTCPGKI